MYDTTLYEYLLGLVAPWRVERVALDVKGERVEVWVGHPEGERWRCPKCGEEMGLYDHAPERSWRHLDSCQFQTIVHARPPRVQCAEHGVVQIEVPWAEGWSRFSMLFERFAIDVLQETSIEAGTRLLGISWDEAWGIMDRAVKRGQARKSARVIRQMGVDEKSVGRGQRYVTVVTDLEGHTVEGVETGREKESLERWLRGLTREQLEGIEAVSMDMWEAYIGAVKAVVPGAEEKIVFDRYHIMQHMGEAVDKVRRSEQRVLAAGGETWLKGTRYWWLYGMENLPAKYWDRFDAARGVAVKTSRAWALKEALRMLWGYKKRGWAMRHWKRWYYWATHSKLEPVVRVAKMLKRHLENVMTYFAHRITNAGSEGMNSRIETLWKQGCGFRNVERFKTVILFHLGGLDLYPATH